LILFGLAMNPNFHHLKVGITDYSNSRTSREFIEVFKQTDAFVISQYYPSQQAMTTDLARGNLTLGITILTKFVDDIARRRTTQVQVLFDAVDANTANIASSYISQLIDDYNSRQQENVLMLVTFKSATKSSFKPPCSTIKG
jgi:ABC-2 type transport system permease protein